MSRIVKVIRLLLLMSLDDSETSGAGLFCDEVRAFTGKQLTKSMKNLSRPSDTFGMRIGHDTIVSAPR
jgi:hypothetical protein